MALLQRQRGGPLCCHLYESRDFQTFNGLRDPLPQRGNVVARRNILRPPRRKPGIT